MGDVASVVSAGRASESQRTAEVAVLLLVDPTAAPERALALKHAFVPELGTSVVRVGGLDRALVASRRFDAAVVLAGADAAGSQAIAEEVARCGCPVALVVESSLDVRRPQLPETVAALIDVISVASADALASRIATWIVAAAAEKRIALAANFPFCRKAAVSEVVGSCALENAAVGAVQIIPGADFPIMCVNQIRLALDIAACHGQPISVERLADIGGVFGVGLLYRYVARTLVGLVPGVGWLLKGAVGYAGTVATGQALSLRFNPDAPSPRQGVERVRDTITQLSRSAADVARVARGEARPAPAATEPAAQVVEAASALPASQPADDYLTIGQQQ